MKIKFPSPLTTFSFIFLTLAIATGCKDDASLAGTDIIPEDELISGFIDSSTPIEAINLLENTRTDNASAGIIGTFNDPMFGRVQSDFLVQMVPDTLANRNIPRDSIQLDGLYLTIPFVKYSWLGDSMAVHKISVYELTDNLSAESYNSDMQVTGLFNPQALCEKELMAYDGHREDTTFVTDAKGIRIKGKDGKDSIKIKYSWDAKTSWKLKLPQEVAKRFLDFAISNNYPLVRKKFLDQFKGIYMTSELVSSSSNSIIPISLFNTDCLSFSLEFTHLKPGKTSTAKDTIYPIKKTQLFKTGKELKRINRFSHSPSESISFDNPNAQNLYIQSMGGSFAKIKIDTAYLYSWKDSLAKTAPRYGISSIDLKLEVDTLLSNVKTYPPISELKVWAKNSKGILTDKLYFEYGSKKGYIFQEIKYNGTSFTYDLKLNPYYFEALMAFKRNPTDKAFEVGGKYAGFTKMENGAYKYIYEVNELNLTPVSSDNQLQRVILKSPSHDASPLKLNVKYFTFK